MATAQPVDLRFRGFWMPLAIGAAAIAIALGVALAVVLARPGTTSAQGSPHAGGGASTPTGAAGRQQVVDLLRADRTWYWHWEQTDKARPFKFVVAPDGRISQDTQPDKAFSLEQRWVLLHDGHLLVPTDAQTLRGFFMETGRQVGAFTEQPAPAGG